jgi:plasminogen activator
MNTELSIKSINSKSYEYVYYNEHKLSELIWKADNVRLLGIQFDYLISKDSFFQFTYKHNISNDAYMDDYDWLIENRSDWSDWSTHPNTVLDKYAILDLSVHQKFKSKFNIETTLLLGYKNIEKSFRAYDGSYIYSSNPGFRDEYGTFSGLGISYEESFQSFYIGVSLKKKISPFIVRGILKYSPIVIVTNEDNHHFRYFVNNNEFDTTTMTDIGIEVEYPLEKNISIVYNYQNVQYKKTKGITTRTYYKDTIENTTSINAGSVFVYSGAGISNSYSSSGLALVVKF